MAVEIKFIIDGLDRGQPLTPEDFSINITEDAAINTRIVSFENELTFGGDVFDYLYSKLENTGYCQLIDVTVQYKCASGTWLQLVDGYLVVTECTFDLDKCQVKGKLYDETFSTKINNNKSIPFGMKLTTSKNGTQITPPQIEELVIFNPATGATTMTSTFGYAAYDVFAHLVNCMSDGLVDFDSNFFAWSYPQDEVTVVTSGRNIRLRNSDEFRISFEQLFFALKQKLNLGMGFEKQANGRPLLRIEPVSYFFQSGASANLYDQPDIQMQFDTQRLYASAKFGGSPYLEAHECDGGTTPCSFVQLPFRAFKEETFGFIGECNTANILNLETSEVVFDTNVFEDIIRFNTENYDENQFIVQSKALTILGPPRFSAIKYDIYGIGQTVYNGPFTNQAVSANWLSGYPNSLVSYFQPFDIASTIFDVTYALTLQQVVDNRFNIIDTGYTSLSGFTGHFMYFYDEIVDNGNNFTIPEEYVVPFTGFYTFNCGIIFDGLRESVGSYNYLGFAAGRFVELKIVHLDSAANILAEATVAGYDFAAPGNMAWYENTNAQFVCNQGDLIRVDVNMRASNLGTLPEAMQQFVKTSCVFGNVSDECRTSYFNGSGVPIAPPELQPVDINDVQNYLYKFTRPLSMDEINSIVNNTAKPILLGRKDDPVAVRPTYIKSIHIKSVMRKSADFELRSNFLLP